MRVKLGAGVLFTALSPAAAMTVQFVADSRPLTHMLWLILPIVFLSIGDMSIFTAGTIYIYTLKLNKTSHHLRLMIIFYLYRGL